MSVAALQSEPFTATLLLKRFTCKEVGAPTTSSTWVLVLRWCEGLKSVLRVNSLSLILSRIYHQMKRSTKYWEHAPLETPTGALWWYPKKCIYSDPYWTILNIAPTPSAIYFQPPGGVSKPQEKPTTFWNQKGRLWPLNPCIYTSNSLCIS